MKLLILAPWLLVFMKVLISMPFLTLLERKVLSYMQSRKGPKKVGYLGMLQPMTDGAKLVFKELGTPNMAKMILFWVSPILSFTLMILAWSVFPSPFLYFSFKLGVIFFLCMASLQVYTLLGSGWGSNSKYALLGSMRGAAQTMSYEVSLMFMILFPCSFEFSYNFYAFLDKSFSYILMFFPMFLIWFISCLAETNRAPFDFAEGESELVSGFNVEFSAFEFACLFLSEYGNILLMSFLSAIFFFPTSFFSFIMFGSFFSFCFVWARGCLPRFRYDFLMGMAWKMFLPSCLFMFFLILM